MRPTCYLLMRAYCEVQSEEAARVVATTLIERLSALGMTTIERVERYWKIPTLYEVAISIVATKEPELLLNESQVVLNVAWQEHGSLLMWQGKEQSSFDGLPITWASIELIET